MNSLAQIENKDLAIWNESNLEEIKKLFAPKLTPNEFIIFTRMGQVTGLNPFLREIWAVKYKEGEAAQIFVGRDGYRKSAQRHPNYDYHTCDAVYSNDKFEMNNGEPRHQYSLQDRGILLGAYCVVQRKGSSRPTYVYVDVKEYNKGFSVWKEKPATMIKKVAEAQALKAAFQELFAGTYSEFEEIEVREQKEPTEKHQGVKGLKNKIGISQPKNDVIDAEFNNITDESTENKENEKEIHQEENNEITFDTIEFLMESASNTKDLLEAMKLAKNINTEDKKKVSALFNKRQNELRT